MGLPERWIPRAMLAGAALHVAIGLADPRARELVGAGLVAALDGDPGREAILWFLALGLACLGRLAGARDRRMGAVGGPKEGSSGRAASGPVVKVSDHARRRR